MIDPIWVTMLDSFEEDERRQAILAMGQSRSQAALPHLLRVQRTDPSPQLRQLAHKASNYIMQHAHTPRRLATSTPAKPLFANSPARIIGETASAKIVPHEPEDTTTWNDIYPDIGIFAVVIAILFGFIAIVESIFWNSITPNLNPRTIYAFQAFELIPLSFNPVYTLAETIFSTIQTLLANLFFALIFHAVARYLLGGKGTYVRQLSKTLLPITAIIFVGGILTNFVSLYEAYRLTQNPIHLEILASQLSMRRAPDPQTLLGQNITSLFPLTLATGLLMIIANAVIEAHYLSIAYRFDFGRGLATIILSIILFICGTFSLTFLVIRIF